MSMPLIALDQTLPRTNEICPLLYTAVYILFSELWVKDKTCIAGSKPQVISKLLQSGSPGSFVPAI